MKIVDQKGSYSHNITTNEIPEGQFFRGVLHNDGADSRFAYDHSWTGGLFVKVQDWPFKGPLVVQFREPTIRNHFGIWPTCTRVTEYEPVEVTVVVEGDRK